MMPVSINDPVSADGVDLHAKRRGHVVPLMFGRERHL
jgi:hypothetical protein